MKPPVSRSFLSCFLALMILLSCCPAAAAVPESLPAEETTPPETTLPEETAPEQIPQETAPSEEPPPDATTPGETQPELFQPEALPLSEEPEVSGPGLYFGLLHAHSDISDGTESPEDLFCRARLVPGLDFFAVTDHSDSFDGHKDGSIGEDGSAVSADWAAGKSAAEAVTDASFAGIYGYEMNWPANLQIGHITTFRTPGFHSWQQEDFRKYGTALENYCAALASVPGSVSQFCHPGTQYGTFLDFAYTEEADRAVTLLELGSGEDACRYYTKALDLGWHLAPVSPSSDLSGPDRTVVFAQSLTEAAILDALGSCCAYATEDSDLEIRYTMNSHPMGSRLKKRHTGDTIRISAALNDPSGDAIGLVEVITNGGRTAAQQTLDAASGTLEFSLPPESGYYFLRIIQPDGDRAVTAPIWLDAQEQLGISDLTCETAVPVQNEPLQLELELYNREDVDFAISGLEVLADGSPIHTQSDLCEIPAGSHSSHRLSFCADCIGVTDITVRLSGTLEGSPRTYETSLSVSFRRSEQVTSILLDGNHGNLGLGQLTQLNQMAMAEDIRLTTAHSGLSADALKDCRLLIVTPPSQPFSDAFLRSAADFAGYGGSILICGQDGDGHSTAQLNRLLLAIGSTMRILDMPVTDDTNNGGEPGILFPDTFNFDSSWCDGISENQVYRCAHSCSVDPGSGTWLVRNSGDMAPLACEVLPGGGTAFASGSLFLSDTCLEPPRNIWDDPYANRTLAGNLLGIGGDILPLSTIAQARSAQPGTPLRIRGYATTGTSNSRSSLSGLLYLQDDTGGIALTAFDGKSIQTGTPLEVVGYAGDPGANRTLKTGSWTLLNAPSYQYLPLEGSWNTLLDTGQNSQRLIQVEGNCLEIHCREDGTLAGCLLKDNEGNTVRIRIGEQLCSNPETELRLQKMVRKNRIIRATGLLQVDEYGEKTIQVRNCEEVVWVPPKDYVNPKTGDLLIPCGLSGTVLTSAILLFLRKQKFG